MEELVVNVIERSQIKRKLNRRERAQNLKVVYIGKGR